MAEHNTVWIHGIGEGLAPHDYIYLRPNVIPLEKILAKDFGHQSTFMGDVVQLLNFFAFNKVVYTDLPVQQAILILQMPHFGEFGEVVSIES